MNEPTPEPDFSPAMELLAQCLAESKQLDALRPTEFITLRNAEWAQLVNEMQWRVGPCAKGQRAMVMLMATPHPHQAGALNLLVGCHGDWQSIVTSIVELLKRLPPPAALHLMQTIGPHFAQIAANANEQARAQRRPDRLR